MLASQYSKVIILSLLAVFLMMQGIAYATPINHLILPEKTGLGQPTIPKLEQVKRVGEMLSVKNTRASLRPRYEQNAKNNQLKTAHAFTVRGLAGIQSNRLGILDFNAEAIGVLPFNYTTYNSTQNGETAYQIIADPRTLKVNQGYLGLLLQPQAYLKGGRQLISLDNQRFVGPVAFRQTMQTFDAASLYAMLMENTAIFGAWLGQVNTVTDRHIHANDWLIHVESMLLAHLNLISYLYLLDHRHALEAQKESSATIGARLVGEQPYGNNKLQYVLELAHQQNYANNPLRLNTFYYDVELGFVAPYFGLYVANEVLSGQNTLRQNLAFQTPLATKHIFQGWADLFLITPAEGIDDKFLTLTVKLPIDPSINGALIYHNFRTQRNSHLLGNELDSMIEKEINKQLGIKAEFAYFKSSAILYPTTRIVWITLNWKIH